MTYGPRFGFVAPIAIRAKVMLPRWRGRLRLAHLTDLHFGNVTPLSLLRAAVALANAENPDLVVLTGDFVARGRRHLDRVTEVLGELEAPAVAVLGNHDHWVDAVAVREVLVRLGIDVLDNAWTLFGHGEDALALVGVDDLDTDHTDAMQATAGLGQRPALGLSHNPEAAPQLWGRGVGLVLAGHTHGGQIHVHDWTRAVYEKLVKVNFLSGWYARDGRQVYVNPGVGSSMVPWRYGRPAMRSVGIVDLVGGPMAAPVESAPGDAT